MAFPVQHERREPTHRDKTKMCKESMVALTRFALYGAPLRDFEAALLLGETPRLGPTRREWHNQEVVTFVRDWIAKNFPSTAFSIQEDIEAWRAHKGLQGAGYERRMWFRLISDWWDPHLMADPT